MKTTKNNNIHTNKIMSIQELLYFEQKYCDMLNYDNKRLSELREEQSNYIANNQCESEGELFIINQNRKQIDYTKSRIDFAKKQIVFYRQEINKAITNINNLFTEV